MRRGKPMKRTTRMKQVSDRRREGRDEYEVIAQRVMMRDRWECQAVGVMVHECSPKLDVHHRKMRSQGGEDTPENLLTLCRAAHRTAHANPEWSYTFGLLIRRDDPVTPFVRA